MTYLPPARGESIHRASLYSLMIVAGVPQTGPSMWLSLMLFIPVAVMLRPTGLVGGA